MRRILSASQMRKCDGYTSEYFGVEPVVLMERAALTTFISVCNCGRMYEDSKTLIICGTGNNGADGLALARILFEGGYPADFCIPFDSGKRSGLFEKQLRILEKYGKSPISADKIKDEYDIVVDALFGIGLSRPLHDETVSFVEEINKLKGFHVAMDIPSGINADTGAVMGAAFEADLTVTYGFAKPGLVLYPGSGYAGELLIANIGITDRSLEALEEEKAAGTYDSDSPIFVMEKDDLVRNLPVRPDDGNKGTFGKILIFAGSKDISGAATLSALAALKAGAGMVKLVTDPVNAQILKTTVPEAMVTTIGLHNYIGDVGTEDFPIGEDKENILKDIEWADVILAGPGIGTTRESKRILELLLENSGDKPVVIDADGLNIIADKADGISDTLIKGRRGFTVFTPHIGELSRLTGINTKALKEDPVGAARSYAADAKVCLVSKDAVTVVTEGREAILISSGNNGMATAGSGDVLAGIIAAFLGSCRGRAREAVLNAVYIHGMSGTACLESMSEDSVTAGDIIVSLQRVMKLVRDEQKKTDG